MEIFLLFFLKDDRWAILGREFLLKGQEHIADIAEGRLFRASVHNNIRLDGRPPELPHLRG